VQPLSRLAVVVRIPVPGGDVDAGHQVRLCAGKPAERGVQSGAGEVVAAGPAVACGVELEDTRAEEDGLGFGVELAAGEEEGEVGCWGAVRCVP